MQSAKKIIFLQFFILVLGAVSCSSSDSFEEAIAKHKNTSLVEIPQVKDGLPWYLEKTLTPTWEEKDRKKFVHIPDFYFVNQAGEKNSQAIFQNKITVVSFLFTSCQGYCPGLLVKLKKIAADLSARPDVQFVVFTVDPEVDTPEVLSQYAREHALAVNQNWTLLTGDKKEIYSLIRETFASEVKKLPADDFRKFAHTEHFYVIDPKGFLRGIINGTRLDYAKQILDIVEKLAVEN